MKLILAIVDDTRAAATRRDLAELGAPGYTELPVTSGSGATGVHAGDRVHPGGLVLIFAAADDAAATTLFEKLARRRDAAGDPRQPFLPAARRAANLKERSKR